MRRFVCVGIWVAVSVSAGCELPDPVSVGGECPGITADHIVWLDSDPCMNEEDREKACRQEAEEVIHLGTGYCPERFVCREDKKAHYPICVHGCTKEKVLCGEDCIDPKNNLSHCRANVNGLCNSDDPENKDYQGEDCMGLIFKDWRAYVCDEEQGCQKTDCGVDEYWKQNDTDGECVKNDKENCGSEGFKCAEDEECTLGECLKECTKQYIRCYVPGEGNACIDPQSHAQFCGARGKCISEDAQSEDYRGVVCEDGMHCFEGECMLLKCDASNAHKVVCGDQCVDMSKDPLNCGGCGTNCANHRPAHATTDVRCEDQKCIYTCEPGYEKCDTDGTTECVDIMDDRKNCGACGHVCEPNEHCLAGTCRTSFCLNEYACLRAGTCVTEDPTACGSPCAVCNVANASNTCTADGRCTFTCTDNYHLNSDGTGCEINTVNDCGASHAVCNVANASNACNTNGQCTFTCNSNYHKNKAGTGCEINTVNDCGASHAVCKVANANNACNTNGQCTFACNSNYCQSGSSCVYKDFNTDANNCGRCGNTCPSDYPMCKTGRCCKYGLFKQCQ